MALTPQEYAAAVATPGLFDTGDRPFAECVDHALCDLDGVTYHGLNPVAYAAEGLAAFRQAGNAITFVTNNASREPQDVADQLTSLDIPTQSSDVMTAAQAAARYLGEFVAPGSRVLVVGGPGIQAAVADAGYQIVTSADDKPAAVAQGYGPQVGWKDLAEAAYAIAGGAIHVASNLDLSLPTTRGFAPGNGALVRAVVAATGIEPVSAGKPSPAMYQMALATSGAQAPAVVGDRLDTDLAGARTGGFLGVHVLTGVSTGRDAVLAAPGLRPHVIIEDLRGLTAPHRAPVSRGDGWWELRDSAARIAADAVLELIAGPQSSRAEVIRVAAAAAWDFADHGGSVDPLSIPDFDVIDH